MGAMTNAVPKFGGGTAYGAGLFRAGVRTYVATLGVNGRVDGEWFDGVRAVARGGAWSRTIALYAQAGEDAEAVEREAARELMKRARAVARLQGRRIARDGF